MVFKTRELIAKLNNLVCDHYKFVSVIEIFPNEILQQKLNEKSWSILECIEHLNLYGKFYLPEIEKRMKLSDTKFNEQFKSGFIGNKLALQMLPKEQMKTMKTFRSKNPIYATLDKDEVLETFLHQQKKMVQLLEVAKTKNLNKIKTSLTLPLLKFKLGDTLRFVIYHNERHIEQAKKVLKTISKS